MVSFSEVNTSIDDISSYSLIEISSSSSNDHDDLLLPLPTLPNELLEEIFCRLPIKLLLQLRCLSKSLNSLISDLKFTKKHLQMSTKNHHLIVTTKGESYVRSYPIQTILKFITINANIHNFPLNEKDFHIVCSCDGILCLVVNLFSIMLWNPSIKKFKLLPPVRSPFQSGSSANVAYGFGYDTFIENYKVVVVFIDASGNKSKIKVHALGTNFWRVVQSDIPVPVDGTLNFVSGTLNWFEDKDYNIVSFNLVNETYQIFMQPGYGIENVVSVNLGVLRDCLCIFANTRDFFDVWQMKQFGNEESWSKLCRVPFCSYFSSIKEIWISDDDQVFLVYTKLLRKNVVVFDINSSIFKIPKIQKIDSLIEPKIYVESLISPCF
ncbi:F-box/kelch-repeat protein At3g23880-like [Vicia villosa]|uniref:F-box/kelch-repeat protein At3g23880-like n=1 Tax=Vicia villosa TaxID=3911 RepID=UPI00273CF4A8|nr:F-box/kelch-repeat protein At3g23880-like [Vicia villosa]